MSVELNTEIVAPIDDPRDTHLLENDGNTNERNETIPSEATQQPEQKFITKESEEKSMLGQDERQSEPADRSPLETVDTVLTTEIVAPSEEAADATADEKTETVLNQESESNKKTDIQVNTLKGEVMEEATKGENGSEHQSAQDERELSEKVISNGFVEDSLLLEELENMIKSEESDSLLLEDSPEKVEEQSVQIEIRQHKRLTPDLSIPDNFLQSDQMSFTFSSDRTSAGSHHFTLVEEASPQVSFWELDFDRSLYYELHAISTNTYTKLKRRNNYLQTRLANYYLKRRMLHVLMKDKKTLDENQKKYEKILDELDAVMDNAGREQSNLEHEMEDLRKKHHLRTNELQSLFATLQKAEFDFSNEIINANEDGKLNAQKKIERYLKRQRTEVQNLSNMRLVYIKLLNKYNENQEFLDSSDNLGPNLRLIDYEQLKTDNRTLQDKLEEKELLLSTLRKQCQNTMQILAHNREKVNAMEIAKASFYDTLDEVTGDCFDAREQVTLCKIEKGRYRDLISKTKDKIGLLAKPTLLRDMEKALEDVKETKNQIELYKDSYRLTSQMIVQLKKIQRMYTAANDNKLSHESTAL